MSRFVQLATISIDVEAIGDVEEFDDYAILWFGPDPATHRLVLGGDDFVMWKKFNEEELNQALEILRQRGWDIKLSQKMPAVLTDENQIPF